MCREARPPVNPDPHEERYERLADYHAGDAPAALSSWSWAGIAALAIFGSAAGWLIVKGLLAIIYLLYPSLQ